MNFYPASSPVKKRKKDNNIMEQGATRKKIQKAVRAIVVMKQEDQMLHSQTFGSAVALNGKNC